MTDIDRKELQVAINTIRKHMKIMYPTEAINLEAYLTIMEVRMNNKLGDSPIEQVLKNNPIQYYESPQTMSNKINM